MDVIICAAPDLPVKKSFHDIRNNVTPIVKITDKELLEIHKKRLTRILDVAVLNGDEVVILGAFGCGAFLNDAHVVSDLFYKALKEFDYDGMEAKDFFRRIDFAVLSRSADQYNYKEFARNF